MEKIFEVRVKDREGFIRHNKNAGRMAIRMAAILCAKPSFKLLGLERHGDVDMVRTSVETLEGTIALAMDEMQFVEVVQWNGKMLCFNP